MTVYSNDPIRIKITEKDLWNLTHKKGIDSCSYPSDQPNEFFIKFATCDINPYNPKEENYKEDIEKEIEKFHVVQDVVREFKPNRRFNPKSMIIESVLDEKVFEKDNRYDVLLDKIKNPHRLPNSGKLFGTIVEE